MISLWIAGIVAVWLLIGYGTYCLVYKHTDNPLERIELYEDRWRGIAMGPLPWILAGCIWLCDLVQKEQP